VFRLIPLSVFAYRLDDPDLDPDLASLALSTMISRSAYAVFVLGTPPADVEQLAATLTRLWVNGLRIGLQE
jgi:hypothetical protein